MLIVDMSDINMIDLSGVYAMEDFVRNVKSKNINVFISNINSNIKDVMENMNFINSIGEDCYNSSKDSINSIIMKRYDL